MAGKRKTKIGPEVVLRFLGGAALSYWAVKGIINAATRHTPHPASIAIAIFTGLVSLLFLLVGLIMMFGWLADGKRHKKSKKSSKKKS